MEASSALVEVLPSPKIPAPLPSLNKVVKESNVCFRRDCEYRRKQTTVELPAGVTAFPSFAETWLGVELDHSHDIQLAALWSRVAFCKPERDYDTDYWAVNRLSYRFNPAPDEEQQTFDRFSPFNTHHQYNMLLGNVLFRSRLFIRNAMRMQLAAKLAGKDKIRILDIGSGFSPTLIGVLAYFGEDRVEYAGVDIDADRIDECQQAYKDFNSSVSFFHSWTGFNVPKEVKDKKFDLVLFQHPDFTSERSQRDFADLFLRSENFLDEGGILYSTFYTEEEIALCRETLFPLMRATLPCEVSSSESCVESNKLDEPETNRVFIPENYLVVSSPIRLEAVKNVKESRHVQITGDFNKKVAAIEDIKHLQELIFSLAREAQFGSSRGAAEDKLEICLIRLAQLSSRKYGLLLDPGTTALEECLKVLEGYFFESNIAGFLNTPISGADGLTMKDFIARALSSKDVSKLKDPRVKKRLAPLVAIKEIMDVIENKKKVEALPGEASVDTVKSVLVAVMHRSNPKQGLIGLESTFIGQCLAILATLSAKEITAFFAIPGPEGFCMFYYIQRALQDSSLENIPQHFPALSVYIKNFLVSHAPGMFAGNAPVIPECDVVQRVMRTQMASFNVQSLLMKCIRNTNDVAKGVDFQEETARFLVETCGADVKQRSDGFAHFLEKAVFVLRNDMKTVAPLVFFIQQTQEMLDDVLIKACGFLSAAVGDESAKARWGLAIAILTREIKLKNQRVFVVNEAEESALISTRVQETITHYLGTVAPDVSVCDAYAMYRKSFATLSAENRSVAGL